MSALYFGRSGGALQHRTFGMAFGLQSAGVYEAPSARHPVRTTADPAIDYVVEHITQRVDQSIARFAGESTGTLQHYTRLLQSHLWDSANNTHPFYPVLSLLLKDEYAPVQDTTEYGDFKVYHASTYALLLWLKEHDAFMAMLALLETILRAEIPKLFNHTDRDLYELLSAEQRWVQLFLLVSLHETIHEANIDVTLPWAWQEPLILSAWFTYIQDHVEELTELLELAVETVMDEQEAEALADVLR